MPEPVLPSPKSQSNATSRRPAAAVDVDALKFTCWPTSGAAGDTTNAAAGFAPAPTVTLCETEFVRPMLSVTVRVTMNVPALLNECVVVTPDPRPPSPKSHWNDTIVPPVDVLDDASKRTTWWSVGDPGLSVNCGTSPVGGGMMMPGGTRRRLAWRDVSLAKFVPLGVTRMSTIVMTDAPAGAGGAV